MKYTGCADSVDIAEHIKKWEPKAERCELWSICNCKTAMCRVALPDEGCYYYRYFKKIIEEKIKNKTQLLKQNSLKEQILELFQKHYDRNAGQTYLGCSNEERYKLIAQSFDDCLMDIYTLVKNYEGE